MPNLYALCNAWWVVFFLFSDTNNIDGSFPHVLHCNIKRYKSIRVGSLVGLRPYHTQNWEMCGTFFRESLYIFELFKKSSKLYYSYVPTTNMLRDDGPFFCVGSVVFFACTLPWKRNALPSPHHSYSISFKIYFPPSPLPIREVEFLYSLCRHLDTMCGIFWICVFFLRIREKNKNF